MVICLERGADLHMAQLMPLPLSCFSKIQIGFTFLVPAYPGSHRKRAVKRVCVYLHDKNMDVCTAHEIPWTEVLTKLWLLITVQHLSVCKQITMKSDSLCKPLFYTGKCWRDRCPQVGVECPGANVLLSLVSIRCMLWQGANVMCEVHVVFCHMLFDNRFPDSRFICCSPPCRHHSHFTLIDVN